MGRTGFLDYLKEFIGGVSLALSGPFSVPLAIAGVLATNQTAKQVLFGTAAICFIVGSYEVWKRERLRANAAAPRFKISFVEGQAGYDDSFGPAGMRRLSISVRNEGNTALTNCQVFMDAIEPDVDRQRMGGRMNHDPFVLNGTEERFIPLVSFEQNPATTAGVIYLPRRHNDFTSGHRIFDAALGPYTITLRATAAECGAYEKRFRFWVDANRRLHLADA
ncbi:MAG: hypothetical protein AB1508_12640 [Pseudomonadota bacterium]